MIIAFIICALAFQTFINQAYAQLSEFKITAADGDTLDSFGWSVSISGDFAVVGAFKDDDNGLNSGSAYIFRRAETSWIEEAKLLPSDVAAGDQFGLSVSISGDYAVVGAQYDDDNGTNAGSAYVFKRSGTNWTLEAQLLASDGATRQFFGYSVSISGDYAVVGAFQDDDNGIYSGSAYIFKRAGTSWIEEAKLLPSDGAEYDNFGFSVSISGDYTVVGAFKDDDNGSSSGSAYLFKRSGTNWVQEAKLLPSDGAPDDWFGNKVSIFGDYAVVGAWGDDDNGFYSGSAYIFKRTGTKWMEEAKLLPSDGAESDYFGFPVSISGDYAVVGAVGNDDVGNGSGSAYVFKRTGTSWVQEAKLLPSDGTTEDHFGLSTSISSDYAVVGAYADDDNGSSSGSVYLYTGFAAAVAVENEEVDLPVEFVLSQNYPNPFNPETKIWYSLPHSGDVNLIIYNILGKEVARLVDGFQTAGKYNSIWNASNFASGIYFFRLQAGDFVQTKKMALLK